MYYTAPLSHYLNRYLRSSNRTRFNHRTAGPLGSATTDFVYYRNGVAYGFNLTPEGLTEEENELLHQQDAMVMQESDIAMLYRFRAQDLGRFMPDLFVLLSLFESGLVSPRHKLSLWTCASVPVRQHQVDRMQADVVVPLPDWDTEIRMRRLTRRNQGSWLADYKRFVQESGYNVFDPSASVHEML